MATHGSSVSRRGSTTHRSGSIPTSTLLLTGLACCVCSSTHRGESSHEHVILLALAHWSWRLGEDVIRSKRRRRKVVQGPFSRLAALTLGAQASLLPLCLHQAGPLRTTLLLILCRDAALDLPSVHIPSLILRIIAAVILLARQSYDEVLSVLPLIGLCATTILGRYYQTAPDTAKSERPSTRALLLQSAGISTSFLAVLWTIGAISLPRVDDFTIASSLLSILFACLLARYLPLNRITSSGSIIGAFNHPREEAIVIGSIIATQLFALPPPPSRLEVLGVLPLCAASIYLKSRASSNQSTGSAISYSPAQISASTQYNITGILPSAWRPHFQTILRTPTSSKIFYFLLLNLAYMAVQMAYGVITNSLGLISDAIHMLFDCLGLAVGLWASVAATWKPDGRYTYGYSRVETLSGFANGCFLILISVFIIFEAIQRIIDPPEVSTHQLLLVSTIGLLINLWGMYATGGHHHHGHSHGHSHEHNHVPVNEKKVDHRHVNGRAHSKTLTKKSSAHELRPSAVPSHAHRRVSATTIQHHEHSHGNGEPCDHDHDYGDDHNHSSNDQHHTHHGHDHHDHIHDSHDHHHTHDGHAHSHHDPAHHDHGHSHGHAHSHNMRGVFLHVLADTLGSVGVIVSTILIRLTGWTVFDPLASLFIAALIMASVIPLVIDSAKVLCLDVGAETEVQIRTALSELASVEGLSNYSSPRFWPTCEGEVNGSVHIQLAPVLGDTSKGPSFTPQIARPGNAIYYNADKVVARIERVLKAQISGLTEVVIQVEGSEERSYCSCMTGGG